MLRKGELLMRCHPNDFVSRDETQRRVEGGIRLRSSPLRIELLQLACFALDLSTFWHVTPVVTRL
jgi:hypothetical protein